MGPKGRYTQVSPLTVNCTVNRTRHPAVSTNREPGRSPHLARQLRLDVVIRVPTNTPDKREVGGVAALACGVLAMLTDASNPPGPILGN